MKKIFACTLIALGCMAGTAHATPNIGEIQFIGSVSDVTCDLTPEVNGAANGVLQLVTAPKGAASGTPTAFRLTLDESKPGCDSMASVERATIAWNSGNLGPNGLENQAGNATGAWVHIKTVNSDGGPADIKKGNQATDFLGSVLVKDGAKYTAELNGGNVPGTFSSTAAFVVAYK